MSSTETQPARAELSLDADLNDFTRRILGSGLSGLAVRNTIWQQTSPEEAIHVTSGEPSVWPSENKHSIMSGIRIGFTATYPNGYTSTVHLSAGLFEYDPVSGEHTPTTTLRSAAEMLHPDDAETAIESGWQLWLQDAPTPLG